LTANILLGLVPGTEYITAASNIARIYSDCPGKMPLSEADVRRIAEQVYQDYSLEELKRHLDDLTRYVKTFDISPIDNSILQDWYLAAGQHENFASVLGFPAVQYLIVASTIKLSALRQLIDNYDKSCSNEMRNRYLDIYHQEVSDTIAEMEYMEEDFDIFITDLIDGEYDNVFHFQKVKAADCGGINEGYGCGNYRTAYCFDTPNNRRACGDWTYNLFCYVGIGGCSGALNDVRDSLRRMWVTYSDNNLFTEEYYHLKNELGKTTALFYPDPMCGLPPSWVSESVFTPPYPIVVDGQGDRGVRFVDVNNDGRLDMVYHRWINKASQQKGAYINTIW
jgi:hypothetical protein